MRLNRHALTDMREARGWSKSDLAVQAQISLSYLSELESGVKDGSPRVVVALAEALKCSSATLLLAPDGTESPTGQGVA